jgi:hypothetical protein
LFSAGLVPNLSHSKILKNKIIIYIINMLRVKWSNLFGLIISGTSHIDIISLHSLFKKVSTHPKNEKFFNLKSRVFEDNFRTLKRKDPIINNPRQDFYNKILTDFDKSVDKISHFKLFTVFLKANSTLGFTNFVPHTSQRAVFVRYYKKGVAISSIPRFYSSWTNAYNLLFNIIFYRIDILTFGSAFFKNEILALNWGNKNLLNSFWRYAKPFLIYQSVKINDYGNYVFRSLNRMGYYTSLVLDISYHKKTIYYLRRSKFYVIGIVPSNYDIKSVDFSLPIINDSMSNQLFFIRLILLIKKNVKSYHFKELKSLWLKI